MNYQYDTCGKCNHFMAIRDASGVGACHRYPPTFVGEDRKPMYKEWPFRWEHPLVLHYHCCGEFVPREGIREEIKE